MQQKHVQKTCRSKEELIEAKGCENKVNVFHGSSLLTMRIQYLSVSGYYELSMIGLWGLSKLNDWREEKNIPKQCLWMCLFFKFNMTWKIDQLHSQWDVLKIQAEKTKTATSSIFYIWLICRIYFLYHQWIVLSLQRWQSFQQDLFKCFDLTDQSI